jgi:DNA-binding NarL/FixJ family response regulator
MIQDIARRVSVLIAHSEPILVIGLATILRGAGEFDVYLQGEDSTDKQHVADVIVADHPSAALLLAESRDEPQPPSTSKILVVSYVNDEQAPLTSERVRGYLRRGCGVEELIAGVRAISGEGL